MSLHRESSGSHRFEKMERKTPHTLTFIGRDTETARALTMVVRPGWPDVNQTWLETKKNGIIVSYHFHLIVFCLYFRTLLG